MYKGIFPSKYHRCCNGNMNIANMNTDSFLRGKATQISWLDIDNILHSLEEKILCLPTKLESNALITYTGLGSWFQERPIPGFVSLVFFVSQKFECVVKLRKQGRNIKLWMQHVKLQHLPVWILNGEPGICIIKPTPSSPQLSNCFLGFQEL